MTARAGWRPLNPQLRCARPHRLNAKLNMLIQFHVQFRGAVHDVIAADGAREGLVLEFLPDASHVYGVNAAVGFT